MGQGGGPPYFPRAIKIKLSPCKHSTSPLTQYLRAHVGHHLLGPCLPLWSQDAPLRHVADKEKPVGARLLGSSPQERRWKCSYFEILIVQKFIHRNFCILFTGIEYSEQIQWVRDSHSPSQSSLGSGFMWLGWVVRGHFGFRDDVWFMTCLCQWEERTEIWSAVNRCLLTSTWFVEINNFGLFFFSRLSEAIYNYLFGRKMVISF